MLQAKTVSFDTQMKFYFVVGEASGDLHAANLITALRRQHPAAQFRAMGGDRMAAAGATLGLHYGRADFVGFVEVVRNLPLILRMFKVVEQDILAYQPDVVILVDYPGFNLRMARFLHKRNIRVFYYISPQVWAWKSGRVKQIKQYVQRMFCILPFEPAFYNRWNYAVDYVGHPLLDAIDAVQHSPNTLKADAQLDDRPIIALLPGSRGNEIKQKLPVMLEATQHLATQYQLVIAGAPNQPVAFYATFLKQYNVKLVHARTYDLLRLAHAALVTSGTATLETALFGVPQAVCYKGAYISYYIARLLVRHIRYISLVNLIMDKPVVKEYIQHEMNAANLRREIDLLVAEGPYRQNILNDYANLRHQLGDGGASERTAQLMLGYLKHTT
jgi:lipid-A-disaccharide synthase